MNEEVGEIYRVLPFLETLRATDSLTLASALDRKSIRVYVRNAIKTNLAFHSEPHISLAPVFADSALMAIAPHKQQFPKEYFLAIVAKGNVAIQSGNYEEGLDWYHKAKGFATENLDDCHDAEFEEEVGNLLYSQQRYSEAMYFYKETLLRRTRCLTDKNLAFYFLQKLNNNIALCYQNLQKPDSAIHYYSSAIQVILDPQYEPYVERTYVKGAAAVVEGNMGGVYAEMKAYALAETLLVRSISVNSTIKGNVVDAQLTTIKLAHVYIETGRLEEAKLLIDSVELQPAIRNNKGYQYRLAKAVWKYYEAQKAYPRAYEAYLAYVALGNELDKNANRWRSVDIRRSLEFRDRMENERRLEQANVVKNSILACAGFGLLLLGWVLVQNKRQQSIRRSYVETLEKSNRQLNQSYRDIQRSFEENASLLRIVAHDLKNPVSAIYGLSEELMSREDLPSADVKDTARIMFNAASGTLALIEEVLVNQGVPAGTNAQRTDLREVLAYSVSVAKFKANQKGISFQFDAEQVFAMVDPGHVWRIFANLLSNAVKFSHENGVVSIKLRPTGKNAEVRIEDSGLGIPPHMAPFLFSPHAGTTQRSGTKGEISNGLGLVLCKKLTDANGGTIRFESEEGRGTVFIVTFSAV